MTIDPSFGQPPVTIIEIPVPTTTTPVATSATTEVAEPTSTVPISVVVAPPREAPASSVPAGAVWLGLGVILIATVLLGLRQWRKKPPPPQMQPIGAIPLIESRGFEAIEYRTGGVLAGSKVRAKSISTFPTLEEAIAAAREARLSFQPDANNADAWWVIWNLTTQRAAWIAEWATPGESIVDLRTGQREPYLAGDLTRGT